MPDLPDNAIELCHLEPGQRVAFPASSEDSFGVVHSDQRPGRLVFIPDPEPEWRPKVGDWFTLPFFGTVRRQIVDISGGKVAYRARSNGEAWASRRPLADVIRYGTLCDPPDWDEPPKHRISREAFEDLERRVMGADVGALSWLDRNGIEVDDE